MKPERWQQIDEFYHAALEREAGERAAFIAEACHGDEELRREVESLVASHDQARSFIKEPVAEAAAHLIAQDQRGTMVGKEIGHYKILSLLGSGGMGEVYLAQDTKLRRQLALKLLHLHLSRDKDRLRRFEQEARAASALNHPNILTIHEIGESDSTPFIATEYIEGETLRQYMTGRPLELLEILEVSIQVAGALSAAHAAGITHRDIKPENIMVRPDGYVKVLDFGLAKMARPVGQSVASEIATLVETSPGMVMGTVRYMSPEQSRGEQVSCATDIFSLGIILYEMATGRHPFTADSQIGVLNAILSQPVLPPSRLNPEISATVEALILRMLEKDHRLRPGAAEVNAVLSGLAGRSTSTETRAAMPLKRHTVGREKERAELRDAFESAVAGHNQLLCVTGEPGIGKTTFVEDFLGELEAVGRSCSIARGRCSERLAGAEAYLPILEALETLLHGEAGESAARLMRLVAPTWYVQVAPLAADDSSDARLAADVKAGSQERMKREFSAFLQEVSRLSPLVLFFDDLHWADVSTVDLLSYVASKFAAMRVLVVATYRPSELLLAKHPFLQIKLDLQARGVGRELRLDFLNRDDIERYLALEFPEHRFPSELPALIHAKTEGSPLFMVDLVRYLRDRKVIAEEQGRWTLAQSIPDLERELPESARSMIERKIDQLGETDRRLLVGASVQGYEFDSAVVGRALGMDAAEVEERLEILERVHAFVRFINEDELPTKTLTLRYRFVHVLYQNALYASLRPTRKAALSRAVAQAILDYYGEESATVASELALLFEAARDFARAAEYFLIAAQNALQVSANQETVELARRGLELLKKLPDTPARARQVLTLQITLGVSLATIKGWGAAEVENSYRCARELCQQFDETPQLLTALWGLWLFYLIRAEYETTRELAEQYMRLARRRQDSAPLAIAHYLLGNTLFFLGEPIPSRAHFEQAIALYDPQQCRELAILYGVDIRVTCRAMITRVLWHLGYPDQALDMAHEALSLAEELPHPQSLGLSLVQAAVTHQLCRDGERIQERAEAAIKLSHEQGLTQIMAWATALRGRAAAEQGQVEEGIAQLHESLALQRSIGSSIAYTYHLALLAEALGQAGQAEEGLTALAEALDFVNRTSERYYEAELYRLKGELLLMQAVRSDSSRAAADTPNAVEAERTALAEAEAGFRQAIEIARQQGAKSLELRAVMSLSRLYQKQGKQEEVRRMLAEAYGWFTEGFETADLIEAKALIEELSRD